MNTITAIAEALAAVSKEVTQHGALKNSPEMQRALVIQRIQEVLDQHRKDISDENLEAIRLMVAPADSGS